MLNRFFFNDTATTEIYTLSLHDALPISRTHRGVMIANRSWGKKPMPRARGTASTAIMASKTTGTDAAHPDQRARRTIARVHNLALFEYFVACTANSVSSFHLTHPYCRSP